MKYLVTFISIIFVLSTFTLAQGIGDTQYEYKKGEIIVAFNDNVSYDDAVYLMGVYSLNYTNSTWASKVLIAKVFQGKEQKWIDEFSKQSIVRYAELNYVAVVLSNNSTFQEIEESDTEFKKPQVSADNWMYGFKRFGESLTAFFTFDQKQKALLNQKLFKERISELKDLADREKDIKFFTEDLLRQTSDLNDSIQNINPEFIRNSSDNLEKSIIVLQLVYQKVPDRAKVSIERAINKTVEIRSYQQVKLGIYDDYQYAYQREHEKYTNIMKDVKKYTIDKLTRVVDGIEKTIEDTKSKNESIDAMDKERNYTIENIERISGKKFRGCSLDSDCVRAGCSGELCVSFGETGTITPCIYKPEYDCFKLTSCGCDKEKGLCRWEENEEFSKCWKSSG